MINKIIVHSGNGIDYGLSVALSPDYDDYTSYPSPIYGINVAIHERESFHSDYFYTVQPGYAYNFFLSPSVLASDNNLRSLRPIIRNCLFNDEVIQH